MGRACEELFLSHTIFFWPNSGILEITAWFAVLLKVADLLYKFAGNGDGSKPPPTSRSLKDILASIQRSKVGLQDWSLSDLTIGLYLIYLRQASSNPAEDFKGAQISCNSMVISEPLLLI